MDLFSLSRGSGTKDLGILICHGFGASAYDLCDLQDYIDPELKADWYFPQGPYNLGGNSWAWFPENEEHRKAALYGAYFQDLEEKSDAGLEISLELLKNFMNTKAHKEWILGGFSQGSMISLHLAFETDKNLSSVLLYSSALFDLKRLSRHKEPKKWSALVSHGTYDPVLSFEGGKKVHSFLQNQGIPTEFLSFPGYHEIPQAVLERSIPYIQTNN